MKEEPRILVAFPVEEARALADEELIGPYPDPFIDGLARVALALAVEEGPCGDLDRGDAR